MPKYIYGIDNVIIRFDDQDGFYEAGQVLSGKIIVHVSDTTSFAGIQLILKGEISTYSYFCLKCLLLLDNQSLCDKPPVIGLVNISERDI